jgi:hypothetical protein
MPGGPFSAQNRNRRQSTTIPNGAADVIGRKGSRRHPASMTNPTRRSPADRDRAVAKLRTLTIGSAIGGLVAFGAFGAVAAASYRGSESTAIVTAAVSTSGTSSATSTTTGTSMTSAPATDDSTTAAAAATATATATAIATTTTTLPTVTSTVGAAQATSGGS